LSLEIATSLRVKMLTGMEQLKAVEDAWLELWERSVHAAWV
jgi:hypothetical protein